MPFIIAGFVLLGIVVLVLLCSQPRQYMPPPLPTRQGTVQGYAEPVQGSSTVIEGEYYVRN